MSNYLFKHPVNPLNNVDDTFVNVDNSNWPGGFGSTETSRQFALPDNFSNNAAAANASRLQNGGKPIRKKIKNIVNKYRMASKKMRKQTKKRMLSLYKRKGRGKSSSNNRRNKSMKNVSRHRVGGNAVLNRPIISSQNLKLVNGTNAYVSSGPVDGVHKPYSMLGGKTFKSRRQKITCKTGMGMGMSMGIGMKMKRGNKKQKGGYHQFQSDIPMTQTYSRGGVLDAKDLALANPAPYQVLPNCTNCVDNYNYNTNKGFQFWGN